MRYPKIAVALAVVSVLVGARNVSASEYGPGDESVQLIDFVMATGITFLFWYGVVLLVGWAYRKLTGASVDGA